MTWLGYYLVEQSPFKGDFKTIQTFRQLSSNWLQSSYLETARTLVAGMFRYRFEEIDEWDQETFFKRLAAAEFLVGKNIEPARS
jgi:hypothetical protein